MIECDNTPFVTSKKYFSYEVDDYCPSFESLRLQKRPKTVEDVVNDSQLFWSLFCKAHMKNQDESCIGEELSPELQIQFQCLNAKAAIIEIEEIENNTVYKIHGNKSRIKHLKIVVENLREYFFHSLNNEFTLNFNYTGQVEYHMFFNEQGYYTEIFKRAVEGTPEYISGDYRCIGVLSNIREIDAFCEEYEYKSSIKAAIPKIVTYLKGKYAFENLHIHDLRNIYCRDACEFNTLKEQMKEKYGNLKGLSTANIEIHKIELQALKPLQKFDLDNHPSTATNIELDAQGEAKALNHKMAKIPVKLTDYLESLLSYLNKQGFINPLKLGEFLSHFIDNMTIFSNTISSYFAWSRILNLNDRLKRIKDEKLKLKLFIKNLSNDKDLIYYIVQAKIDGLRIQKTNARLSRISKVLKFSDKIINNILTIKRCLITLGMSLGATASIPLSLLAYTGFWVVVTLCAVKTSIALYKHWNIIPLLAKKIQITFSLFILNISQTYEKKKLHKYSKEISQLKLKNDLIEKSNHPLDTAERNAFNSRYNKLESLKHTFAAIKVNRECLRNRKLALLNQLEIHNKDIEINLIQNKFKKLNKQDLFNLYQMLVHAFGNCHKEKKIKSFLTGQDVPFSKNLSVNDVINYITAEV